MPGDQGTRSVRALGACWRTFGAGGSLARMLRCGQDMNQLPSQVQERRRHVLVVDDDDARWSFAEALLTAGYEVAEGWSVVQAMRLLLSSGAMSPIHPATFGARTILTKPLSTESLLASVSECFPPAPDVRIVPESSRPVTDPH